MTAASVVTSKFTAFLIQSVIIASAVLATQFHMKHYDIPLGELNGVHLIINKTNNTHEIRLKENESHSCRP